MICYRQGERVFSLLSSTALFRGSFFGTEQLYLSVGWKLSPILERPTGAKVLVQLLLGILQMNFPMESLCEPGCMCVYLWDLANKLELLSSSLVSFYYQTAPFPLYKFGQWVVKSNEIQGTKKIKTTFLAVGGTVESAFLRFWADLILFLCREWNVLLISATQSSQPWYPIATTGVGRTDRSYECKIGQNFSHSRRLHSGGFPNGRDFSGGRTLAGPFSRIVREFVLDISRYNAIMRPEKPVGLWYGLGFALCRNKLSGVVFEGCVSGKLFLHESVQLLGPLVVFEWVEDGFEIMLESSCTNVSMLQTHIESVFKTESLEWSRG